MVDVGLYDGSGGGEVVQVQNQLEMMRRWKTEHVSLSDPSTSFALRPQPFICFVRYILLRAAVVFLFWSYIFRTSCDAFGNDTLFIMNIFFGVVVDMLFCGDCIYLRQHMRSY
ncbi:hypothetical protein P8452_38916 [Trifolium repens]|nr:hypothetical protein P8452_38916 [Trifolium repens]